MTEEKDEEKKSGFMLFTEIMGWLQIAASPLLIGALIGGAVYLSNPTPGRLAIGILIALAGLIIGIAWATYVWKKKGTINFVSRIDASPEPDEEEKEKP